MNHDSPILGIRSPETYLERKEDLTTPALTNVTYANYLRRFGAWVVDMVVFCLLMWLCFILPLVVLNPTEPSDLKNISSGIGSDIPNFTFEPSKSEDQIAKPNSESAGTAILFLMSSILLLTFVCISPLIVLLIPQIAFFVWPTAISGKTLGKRLFGIKVVNADGKPPGWRRSLVRYVVVGILLALVTLVAYVMDLSSGEQVCLPLLFWISLSGYLWPLLDKDNQSWSDKIAGTYVVRIE